MVNDVLQGNSSGKFCKYITEYEENSFQMKRKVEELIFYDCRITRFWWLAEIDFQHLSGARNVITDLIGKFW